MEKLDAGRDSPTLQVPKYFREAIRILRHQARELDPSSDRALEFLLRFNHNIQLLSGFIQGHLLVNQIEHELLEPLLKSKV